MKKPSSATPRKNYRRKKRLQIWHAMLELVDEKPLKEITVQEICDRCMLCRTTFYNHFYDIYDLIHFGTRQIIKEWDFENMMEHLPGGSEEKIAQAAKNIAGFIERYRNAIINMSETKFREEILLLTNGEIEKFWNKILQSKSPKSEDSTRAFLISKFVCSGLTGLIDYWTQDRTLNRDELYRQVSVIFDFIQKCL